MIRIEEYVVDGESPFRLWLDSLDPQAIAIAALRRWRDYKKRKRNER